MLPFSFLIVQGGGPESTEHYFYRYTVANSVFVLTIALLIFTGFINLDFKNNTMINSIAKTMFGVYLIHDHILVGQTIYSDVFHCFEYIFDVTFPVCTNDLLRYYDYMYYPRLVSGIHFYFDIE